jgi:hypothetical protein
VPSATATQLCETLDWIATPAEIRLDPPAYHPFPARMPVWLAQGIIERLTDPGDTVADPMVGSGSTAIAALKAGRAFVGADIDPMALLLARVGVTAYGLERAKCSMSDIAAGARRRLNGGLRVATVRSRFDEEEQEFLRYWFPPRSQKELFALASEINSLSTGKTRDLAWTIFSSLIIAKSAGTSFALDIARSRPHKVDDKDVLVPLKGWERRTRSVLSRLPFGEGRSPSISASIRRVDAREAAVADGSVRLVLTSPPYLNAIDYMRAHKFSLLWMGHELDALRDVRGGMIGSERGMYSPDSLPSSMERQIVSDIGEQRRLGLVRRYLSDMRRVLINIRTSLAPGGAAIVALGPSIIEPGSADAGEVIAALAESVGLRSAGCRFRPLEPSRRSLPFPVSKHGGNPLGQRMKGEVFLGLRKP